MTRAAKFFTTLVLFCFLSSCGDDNPTQLALTATPSQIFFLPGDLEFSSDSCYDDSTISETRFVLNSVTSRWDGDGHFTPAVLQVKVKGVNGSLNDFTCTFSGSAESGQNALGIALGYGTDGILTKDDGDVTSVCPIHCGGISLTDGSGVFSTTAQVKLIGINTVNNEEIPATVTDTISIRSIQ